MSVCDICGNSIEGREIQILTEEQVVRATSAGFVPSTLPMQGFVELFGLSLSKADHWKGTVSKFKGTGAKWGVCMRCRAEILNFLDSDRRGKRTVGIRTVSLVRTIDDYTRKREDAILDLKQYLMAKDFLR